MVFKKKAQTVTLQDAVRDGLVTFKLIGAGGGDTSKVHLEIVNQSKAALKIEIPAGTRFTPQGEVAAEG